MSMMQTRRRVLETAALAGVAGTLPLLGARASEPGPETTTIKLPKSPAICTMPQMITGQLLQAEGFTEIRYVDVPPPGTELLARGDVDLMVNYASNFVVSLDKGEASTLLAGVHAGCLVLFGPEDVHSIAGLKGKTSRRAGVRNGRRSAADPYGR
jgi:NitT/TauT family transport system substrate-binding protein